MKPVSTARIALLFLLFTLGAAVFAQENGADLASQSAGADGQTSAAPIESADADEESSYLSGGALPRPNTYPVFSYGAAAARITRIVKQTERSNFVFEDTLVGAYAQMESRNIQPIDSFLRLSIYYPLSFKFNEVPQTAKNVIRYSIDIIAAPMIPFTMWNVVNFSISAGLHFNFQNADRFNYILLGAASKLSAEFPVARYWTVLLDVAASYDYANFGTNRDIEPYDYAWMYQISMGVRYSKKSENEFSYIGKK